VLMLRNPYDAIWSEFQRRFKKGDHVSGIERKGFPWDLWKANAAWLAYRYREMLQVHYGAVKHHCVEGGYVQVMYEELRDPSTRREALRRVTSFLDLSPTRASDDRLDCAFTMSSDKNAHRKVDVNLHMDKASVFTAEVACGMWQVFGPYGVQDLGYALPKHLMPEGKGVQDVDALCVQYPRLKDIELNHKDEPGQHPNGPDAGFGHGMGLLVPMKQSELENRKRLNRDSASPKSNPNVPKQSRATKRASGGAGEGYANMVRVNSNLHTAYVRGGREARA